MSERDVQPKKLSLMRTIKAVAWSFVGIRGRGAFEEDIKRLSLLHLVAVGLVGVCLFVAALVLLANWAAKP